jgi:hypothetical protein
MNGSIERHFLIQLAELGDNHARFKGTVLHPVWEKTVEPVNASKQHFAALCFERSSAIEFLALQSVFNIVTSK